MSVIVYVTGCIVVFLVVMTAISLIADHYEGRRDH